ncbi:MAG: hypothetical protein JWL77_2181 [Chthonomonadaceae bacterium]|nr:hypothetical protein [Chthonomonadaceae bacterium]
MDTLRICATGEGSAVENCLAKIRFFCAYDAFPAYDTLGRNHEEASDRFQSELLRATNAAMRARSSRKAWEPWLDKTLPVLSAIPTDVDLIESTDLEYAQARNPLADYYRALTDTPWITDMAASKMLFLKRPRLTAISDSYVREALGIKEPDTKQHPWKSAFCTERALRVSDAVRNVGLANIERLEELQQELEPIVVSKVRLIDILVWVDMAIRAGHPTWTQAAISHDWYVRS